MLHFDYYADPVTGGLDDIPKDEVVDHANHCIDSIRQSIMCASDIRYVYNTVSLSELIISPP